MVLVLPHQVGLSLLPVLDAVRMTTELAELGLALNH